ncbi:hypothetical protein [Bacillus badius]|uniref:Uncharacterized protein n=1 Tax=Bacillus badius TaxID=1455 RepID=A0ABR5B133_BACBA|nr:hypothetical protein [Bacillus badius]KIL73685.1 hypothetical protein SD78_3873 [Bacillus badius]KIL80693.1 hypothetical protein SD77_0541 [Bacillus badius]MED4715381.1 hypothetical protein [Bacillus badius]
MMSEFEMKRLEKMRREALKNPSKHEWIKIPVFEKIYMIGDELYGEFKGDKTPRRVKDYTIGACRSKKD